MAKVPRTFFEPGIANRAKLSIAHGALTNSKRPSCLVNGIYPTHLSRGHGPYVWDTKGNRFTDFICGLGSSILGYAHEEVTSAIIDQARRGSTLSLGTEIEVQCAEKVKELFPWVERVRFLKTGSDACNAALRIARAKTKRANVISDGYHGWGDDFVSLTPPALGIVGEKDTRKLGSISDIDQKSAAVIIEPVLTDPDRHIYLTEMRNTTKAAGAALIFDEVITGFRWPKMSVSNFFGVQPDLICLGKAMANGMPLAVVAGKAEFMECDEYFVSSTFAGETLSLSAALKTMTLLQTKYSLEHLWAEGRKFQTRFNELLPDQLAIEGYPTRGVFRGNDQIKALFWQEACRGGLLFGPSFFFNFAHIEISDQVLNVCSDIATRIKTGAVKLEGEMPSSPFAQRMREGKE